MLIPCPYIQKLSNNINLCSYLKGTKFPQPLQKSKYNYI
jgi:hypothetical protein